MEKDIIYTIYNALFDNQKALGIKNLQIYTNMEQNLCLKYEIALPFDSETYVISNDLIN